MAQKTYKQIEAEANQKFGKGASKEKFEWRRSQQEAAGLDKETKKRGGVAGTYDRNKALVQAAAPLLAGMLIPGSSALIGGITGGLAKGLDREGKGGIGLDLGQAARGAVAGAGMGQLGSAARGAVGNFMANRAANAATQTQAAIAAGPKPSASLISGSMPPAPTPAISQAAATPSPAELGMGPLRSAPRAARAGAAAPRAAGMPPMAPARPPAGPLAPTQGFGGLGAGAAPPAPPPTASTGPFTPTAPSAPPAPTPASLRSLLTNPQVLAGATGAVADVMGQRSQQRVAEQQLAQQGEQFQQRFGMEEEELKRRQAQANRLAGLFTPTRSFSNLGMGMANGNR